MPFPAGVEAGSARREFLAYCLSLLRAHSAEHAEQLPVLDVAALKHVAYVLDALVYYMRAAQPQPHHHHLWSSVGTQHTPLSNTTLFFTPLNIKLLL